MRDKDIKLFGIRLFKRRQCPHSLWIKKKILFGIYRSRTDLIRNVTDCCFLWIFKITHYFDGPNLSVYFEVPLFSIRTKKIPSIKTVLLLNFFGFRRQTENNRRALSFVIRLYKTNILHRLLDKAIATQPKVKTWRILKLKNIGENYIKLEIMRNLMESDTLYDEGIIVFDKNTSILRDMFCPNIPIYITTASEYMRHSILTVPTIEYRGSFFDVSAFDMYTHLRTILLAGKKKHFCEYIEEEDFYAVSKFQISSEANINTATQEAVAKKMKDKGVGKRFVMIFTESQTATPMSDAFYIELAENLRCSGFDVVFNSRTSESKFGKSISLNLSEMYELAKLSSGVVGIVSGALVMLAGLPIQKHLIYSDQMLSPDGMMMTASEMLTGYTISSLPGVNPNQVFEYIAGERDDKSLIKSIVEQLNE